MAEQIDLDKLSTAEIKRLWHEQTTAKTRNRAAQKTEPVTDVTGDGDDYYIDNFGNAIPGKRPEKKTVGTYVDANGYVQELKPGEKAPALSGNAITDWVNQQDISNDPELRAALGKNNLFFEERFSLGDEDEIVVTGKLETRGWTIDTQSENEKLNLSFRLSRSLTREQAIQQAAEYVESKAGPQFKNLTDAELRIAERMAAAPNGQFQSLVFYVAARLPDDLAEEFLRIGASGDDMAIFNFTSDEGVSEIVQEGVACVFHWTHVGADEAFFDYVRAHDDGKIWNFPLLETLLTRYQVASSVEKLDAQDAPTDEELEQLSDEEIEKTSRRQLHPQYWTGRRRLRRALRSGRAARGRGLAQRPRRSYLLDH